MDSTVHNEKLKKLANRGGAEDYVFGDELNHFKNINEAEQTNSQTVNTLDKEAYEKIFEQSDEPNELQPKCEIESELDEIEIFLREQDRISVNDEQTENENCNNFDELQSDVEWNENEFFKTLGFPHDEEGSPQSTSTGVEQTLQVTTATNSKTRNEVNVAAVPEVHTMHFLQEFEEIQQSEECSPLLTLHDIDVTAAVSIPDFTVLTSATGTISADVESLLGNAQINELQETDNVQSNDYWLDPGTECSRKPKVSSPKQEPSESAVAEPPDLQSLSDNVSLQMLQLELETVQKAKQTKPKISKNSIHQERETEAAIAMTYLQNTGSDDVDAFQFIDEYEAFTVNTATPVAEAEYNEERIIYELDNMQPSNTAPLTVEEMWQASIEANNTNEVPEVIPTELKPEHQITFINAEQLLQLNSTGTCELTYSDRQTNEQETEAFLNQLTWNNSGIVVEQVPNETYTNNPCLNTTPTTASHILFFGDDGNLISPPTKQMQVNANTISIEEFLNTTVPTKHNQQTHVQPKIPAIVSSTVFAEAQPTNLQVLQPAAKDQHNSKSHHELAVIDDDTEVIVMKPLNTRKVMPLRGTKAATPLNALQRHQLRLMRNTVDLTSILQPKVISFPTITKTNAEVEVSKRMFIPQKNNIKFHDPHYSLHSPSEQPQKPDHALADLSNNDETSMELDKIFGRSVKKHQQSGQSAIIPTKKAAPMPTPVVKQTKQSSATIHSSTNHASTTYETLPKAVKAQDKPVSEELCSKRQQQHSNTEYKYKTDVKDISTSYQTKYGTLPKNIKSNLHSSDSDNYDENKENVERSKQSFKCNKCRKIFKTKRSATMHAKLNHSVSNQQALQSKDTELQKSVPDVKKNPIPGKTGDSDDEPMDFVGGSSSEGEFVKKVKVTGDAPQTRSRTRKLMALNTKPVKRKVAKKKETAKK